jgi:hypothetical protein
MADDMALVMAIEQALAKRAVEIDRFFFDWRGGALRGPTPAADAYDAETFADFRRLVAGRTAVAGALDHEYWSDEAPVSMHIDEVEAIWARIDEADDWSVLEAKIKAARRMGEAMQGASSP